MDISYRKPVCTDTAVCMCFFSPAGFQKPKNNFMYVKKLLDKANIPTFTIECVIGNQEPLLKDPTVQVRSNSYLFYKEQLYNLLVPKIPEQYTKLVFIDGDIVFNNKNWIDEISKTLNVFDVVQPFKTAVWLGPYYGTFMGKKDSYMFRLFHSPYPTISELTKYHQGFSFAMTRKFFNKMGGFFDKCIIGGGDTSFALLFYKEKLKYNYSKIVATEYDKWSENVFLMPKRFTYMPFTVYHLYHGSTKSRGYNVRHRLLEELNIENWDDLVYTNEHNVYELKSQQANEIMKQYFLSRNEDGI